eukprot:jgi/Mesvir1/9177/Mv06915-RA.2
MLATSSTCLLWQHRRSPATAPGTQGLGGDVARMQRGAQRLGHLLSATCRLIPARHAGQATQAGRFSPPWPTSRLSSKFSRLSQQWGTDHRASAATTSIRTSIAPCALLTPASGPLDLGDGRPATVVGTQRLYRHAAVVRAAATKGKPAQTGVNAKVRLAGVVVVESPNKVKSIQGYLGDQYIVKATKGHIRDLSPKAGSVEVDNNFAMRWEPMEGSGHVVGEIQASLDHANALILATDPDREGEAIAWHIHEMLADYLDQRRASGNPVHVSRITFNEVTKGAVLAALERPRAVFPQLVDAYRCRRALDYLFGFTLSPLLWTKLPGCKSAGRVQSVALRLICAREEERETFRAREYWTIDAHLRAGKDDVLVASLTHVDGKKLDKFSLGSEGEAKAVAARVQAAKFRVQAVKTRQVKQSPPPPYKTSTMQQDASAKLGMSVSTTMRAAQNLFVPVDSGEHSSGLITYVRTDGLTISRDAIASIRDFVDERYGPASVPLAPREYKSKCVSAQEAHEAIRPTDVSRTPASLLGTQGLGSQELRLYSLIWARTVACQMADAQLSKVAVDIVSEAGDLQLRATGSVLDFAGYLAVAQDPALITRKMIVDDEAAEGDAADVAAASTTALAEEEGDAEEGEGGELALGDGERNMHKRLASLQPDEPLRLAKLDTEQHATQPPPRYSDGTLVKDLEVLGIGRPSTYGPVLRLLEERGYVTKANRRFQPSSRGRLVTAFLTRYVPHLVDYSFTAALETQLDEVCEGQAQREAVLSQFWQPLRDTAESVRTLRVSEVIDALDEILDKYMFPEPAQGEKDPRKCPSCETGRLHLKPSRSGGFIGCSNYPACQHAMPIGGAGGTEGDDQTYVPVVLGTHPETGALISVRHGPYGRYVQMDPPPSLGEEARAMDAAATEEASAVDAAGDVTDDSSMGDGLKGTKAPSKPKSMKAKATKAKALPKGKRKAKAPKPRCVSLKVGLHSWCLGAACRVCTHGMALKWVCGMC